MFRWSPVSAVSSRKSQLLFTVGEGTQKVGMGVCLPQGAYTRAAPAQAWATLATLEVSKAGPQTALDTRHGI
jgi:hypothetical protein